VIPFLPIGKQNFVAQIPTLVWKKLDFEIIPFTDLSTSDAEEPQHSEAPLQNVPPENSNIPTPSKWGKFVL